jgi:ribose transport system permease protein
LLNIVRQTATISIVAVGMTFVIGAGQIDLSVGSIAGLASVTCAMAIATWGPEVGILVGLATGLGAGIINGVFVAYVGVPSFLATLGMLGVAKGVAMWITGTAAEPIGNQWFNDLFGSADFGPVPGLLCWTVVIVAVGHVALRYTAFGRRVLATGGNGRAALFSGVDTKRVTFTVLAVSGLLAGLAGMLYAGRFHAGRFEIGTGDELSVIAAVILGGTSLFGGRATVVGALIGSLMIGLLNNGLILAGLDSSQQSIARGVIIVLAVAVARSR